MKKILSLLAGAAVALAVPALAFAATLSTPITVSTTAPVQGGSMTVSGTCGASGANSTVTFALQQSGFTTDLASTNNLNTDATGAFNGTISLPTTFPGGAGMLIATCTLSGNTLNSLA